MISRHNSLLRAVRSAFKRSDSMRHLAPVVSRSVASVRRVTFRGYLQARRFFVTIAFDCESIVTASVHVGGRGRGVARCLYLRLYVSTLQ